MSDHFRLPWLSSTRTQINNKDLEGKDIDYGYERILYQAPPDPIHSPTLAMTPAEFLNFSWKVRKYNLNGTAHNVSTTGTFSTMEVLQVRIATSIAIPDERHIFYDIAQDTGFFNYPDINGVFKITNDAATFTVLGTPYPGTLDFELDNGLVYFYTNKYYVPVTLNVGLFPPTFLGARWSTGAGGGLAPVGTLTINGQDIRIFYQFISIPNVQFNFTLSPKEFWPYKNSQGQPIYDTTTGAQLNDPFS